VHKVIKNILNTSQCDDLISLLNSKLSDNVVTSTGETVLRTYLNEKWKYFFTRYNSSEVSVFCEAIQKILPDYDIVSFRTMHYPPGAMIGRHTDTYMEQDGVSDTGLIIQLTDTKLYKGGYLRMSNEIMELNKGDAVLYSYDTPHEVTKVKHGDRMIASIRMLLKR